MISPIASKYSLTPYLCACDAAAAIEFYKQAFGATEVSRIPDAEGRVSHAEIRVGDLPIFVSDEYADINVLSPASVGGSPVMLVLEVPDVDAVFEQAVRAGAKVDRPLADQFGGAFRNGKLIDPFGHRWMLMSNK